MICESKNKEIVLCANSNLKSVHCTACLVEFILPCKICNIMHKMEAKKHVDLMSDVSEQMILFSWPSMKPFISTGISSQPSPMWVFLMSFDEFSCRICYNKSLKNWWWRLILWLWAYLAMLYLTEQLCSTRFLLLSTTEWLHPAFLLNSICLLLLQSHTPSAPTTPPSSPTTTTSPVLQPQGKLSLNHMCWLFL